MKEVSDTRNFCIIAHIDHGKSTLADRFLELTGTVSKEKIQPQYLDSMGLEREKGITIKMHPVHMSYQGYSLNLIDTPGHIDFSYEISRALACVEGAVLLVDATKGIQAQTLFNLAAAQEQGLKVIGAVNKIDVSDKEQTEETKKELASLLNVAENEIFTISAKQGTGVKELLNGVIKEIPCPQSSEGLFKGLIFDSKYDAFSGVTAYVRVFEGEVKKNEKLYLSAQNIEVSDKEVGIFIPEEQACEVLRAGQIGYIKTGIKEPSKVKVGDTIFKMPNAKCQMSKPEPLKGYKEPQPALFLSVYPAVSDSFETLKEALSKLKLNDPALIFQPESKTALGRGMRCGFLGSLHAEITVRRLKSEFDLDLILTTPQVIFKILQKDNKEMLISSPCFWPEHSKIKEMSEPWAELTIVTPPSWINRLLKVFKTFKVSLGETKVVSSQRTVLIGQAPLKNIISGPFYDQLKSATQGYASFAFELIGFKPAHLSKIDILVAGEPQEPFSRIVDSDEAFLESKKILKRLKQVLPAQQFSVALQASVQGKIIARETIRALRKDVTAPLYGGDFTRKKKLLEAQKKGKHKLKGRGKVNIPAEAFLEMFKKEQ